MILDNPRKMRKSPAILTKRPDHPAAPSCLAMGSARISA